MENVREESIFRYLRGECSPSEVELKGIQLFVRDKSKDISGPYKVTAIPRFILIDKNGLIVSDQAPRPSSSGNRALLDTALKK